MILCFFPEHDKRTTNKKTHTHSERGFPLNHSTRFSFSLFFFSVMRKRKEPDPVSRSGLGGGRGISREETDAAWDEMRESWYLESIGEHADLADELGRVLVDRTSVTEEEDEVPGAAPRTSLKKSSKLAGFSNIPLDIYDRLVDHPFVVEAKFALQDNCMTFADETALKKFLREEAGLELSITQTDEERQESNLWKMRFVNEEIQKGEIEENDDTNPLTSTLPAKDEKMHSFHRTPDPAEIAMKPELALSPEQKNPVALMREVKDEETLSSLIEDFAKVEVSVQTYPSVKIADWKLFYE